MRRFTWSQEAGYLYSPSVVARARPYTVRTDNILKVRFSAILGQEPEIELALV
jgi:hypothetical protein